MANAREIRDRMRSIQDTMKINAMYMISSSKLRRAKKALANTEPYFYTLQSTMSRILRHLPEMHSEYFRDPNAVVDENTIRRAYVVVTADKGMAGAYNHNILKLAEGKLARHPGASLFVVGQVGRSYFQEHSIPIDVEFLYTAQNPTVPRARDIAESMMDLFLEGSLDDVYVLFTRLVTSFDMEPTVHKLLPLDPDVFPEYEANRDAYNRDVTYVPSVKAVMDRLVPSYVSGDLFGALVESYCSEQNARMTAMKSSSDNARAMLQTLNLSFNRARQAAITQEITEVVGGAQAAL